MRFMTTTAHPFPTAAVAEVAWRRERLLRTAARPRRRLGSRAGLRVRQRLGLGLVQLGLTVAGRLTAATVVEIDRTAPQT